MVLSSILKKCTFLILPLLFFTNCRKEEEPKFDYKIEGILYDGCSRQPLANKKLDLIHEEQSIWLSPHLRTSISNVYTNEAGYFALQYNEITEGNGNSSEHWLSIHGDGNIYITDIPVNENLSGIDLMPYSVRQFDIYLEVKTPYTDKDSLVFYKGFNAMYFQGPFKNGLLFSNAELVHTHKYSNVFPWITGGVHMDLVGESLKISGEDQRSVGPEIDYERCGGTIKLTVEIL